MISFAFDELLPCPHLGPSAEPELVRTSTEEALNKFELISEIEQDDSLPFYGEPLASAVPVGCNVYPHSTCNVQYVWLSVDLSDGVERADERHVGRRHDYFDTLIDDTGWEAILEIEDMGPEGYAKWLLNEGLAPGQRFLVRLEYITSQSYEGEWDSDWDRAIVAREPWGHFGAWVNWALGLLNAEVPLTLLPFRFY